MKKKEKKNNLSSIPVERYATVDCILLLMVTKRSILHEYEDNHNILAIEHMRDTDSNKSSDFLLNPVCIMLISIITVLLCKYLCIVQMK